MERVLRVQDADVAKAKAKALAAPAQQTREAARVGVTQWQGINVKQLPTAATTANQMPPR